MSQLLFTFTSLKEVVLYGVLCLWGSSGSSGVIFQNIMSNVHHLHANIPQQDGCDFTDDILQMELFELKLL